MPRRNEALRGTGLKITQFAEKWNLDEKTVRALVRQNRDRVHWLLGPNNMRGVRIVEAEFIAAIDQARPLELADDTDVHDVTNTARQMLRHLQDERAEVERQINWYTALLEELHPKVPRLTKSVRLVRKGTAP